MTIPHITIRRIVLRDFEEADRAAFLEYQTDPRYLALYDYDADLERPSQLFDRFLQWQAEVPRTHFQIGIFDVDTERLIGCGGLRKAERDVAVLGLELAPVEWGRFRVALDASTALLRHGFETLKCHLIIGNTSSGNRRVEKLASWFGARIVARRTGPEWMQARGWQEVDWALTSEDWQRVSSSGEE